MDVLDKSPRILQLRKLFLLLADQIDRGTHMSNQGAGMDQIVASTILGWREAVRDVHLNKSQVLHK